MTDNASAPFRDTVATAAGVGAVALALCAQQLMVLRPFELRGWALFGVAVAMMMLASRRAWASTPADSRVAMSATSSGMRLPLAAGACLTVIATTALAAVDRWPLATLCLWVGGFVLAHAALRDWIVTPPRRAVPQWSRRDAVMLAGVVLGAAVARFAWIDALPRYYFGDEARVGAFLRDLYAAGIPNPFTMGWNTWPVIGLSLQGMFAPVLGFSTTTLRLSSALVGTLAIPVTYLLARQLYGARVALLAAVLLAICRTAIDFSRLGTCHAQIMVFVPLAFCFWWRAVDGGRATAYLWAGISLGLCLLSYNAGQSAPVLWLGWVLLSWLRWPRLGASHWRGPLITAAGLVLAFFPYFFYVTDHFTFADNWREFTVMARNRQVASQALDLWHSAGVWPAIELVQRQIVRTWLGFTAIPAAAYGLGYRGGGMLDHVSGPLFILGLAWSLPRLLHGREAFVPYWWLATTIIGGVLTQDPPAVVRLVGILPALAILAALPLVWLMDAVERTTHRHAAAIAVAVALLIAAGWDNWRTYFVAFAHATVDDTSELARRVKELPPETPVLVVGSEHFLRVRHDVNLELFAFEFPGRWLRDIPDPAQTFPLREPFEVSPAIVLGPSQASLATYIRELYPRTTIEDVTRQPEGRLLFRWLRLAADDMAQHAGLQRRALAADGALLETTTADPLGRTTSVPPGCARLVWSGSLYWPASTAVELTMQSAAPVVLRLEALRLQQPDANGTARVAASVARGWHPLSLEQRGCDALVLKLTLTDAQGEQVVTRGDLRPQSRAAGLEAVYEREGEAPLRMIDAQLNAFVVEDLFNPPSPPLLVKVPFRATWSGSLQIPSDGDYQFEARGTGPYSIRLDGELLLEALTVKPETPEVASASRWLTAGAHPLQARWDSTVRAHDSRRLFQLFWKPPGSEWELVPPTAFAPGVG